MLLDELSKSDVPPPPDQLPDQIHRRLNRALVVLHFVDLLLRGLPWAAVKFLRPTLAFFKYTLTGRFEDRRRRR